MDGEHKTIGASKFTSRGIQTLFRSVFRTQINLIQIADNKANMIIGINAMIITVIMGFISTGIVFSASGTEADIAHIVPLILVILTSLFTAVLAFRAAKPRMLKTRKNVQPDSTKKSLLFFENIWDMPPEEYIAKMEELLKTPRDIYQNMIIDIHNQAKVLHRKYELLRMAYIVFMVGFSLSIGIFMVSWLL